MQSKDGRRGKPPKDRRKKSKRDGGVYAPTLLVGHTCAFATVAQQWASTLQHIPHIDAPDFRSKKLWIIWVHQIANRNRNDFPSQGSTRKNKKKKIFIYIYIHIYILFVYGKEIPQKEREFSLRTRGIKSQLLAMGIRTLESQCFFVHRCRRNRSDFRPAVAIRNRNRINRTISTISTDYPRPAFGHNVRHSSGSQRHHQQSQSPRMQKTPPHPCAPRSLVREARSMDTRNEPQPPKTTERAKLECSWRKGSGGPKKKQGYRIGQGESNMQQIAVTFLCRLHCSLPEAESARFQYCKPSLFLWELLPFLKDLHFESTVFTHLETGYQRWCKMVALKMVHAWFLWSR